MDVLSDALRVIRLKGSLFLNAEFREPWCVAVPGGAELASELSQGREHLAICHLVVEGCCWAQLPGAEPVRLEAGDVVVLPHGDAHLVGSGLHHAPVAIRDRVVVKTPDFSQIRYGGQGAETVIVCGWFAYDRDVASPAISALPSLFRSGIRRRPSGTWLEPSIRYAVAEAASGQAGSGVIADRLAEILFVEAIRAYIEAQPIWQTGWLAGLRDPVVGKCIALLHERPANDWTVASLARAANVSRTVLAERFVALIGTPPIHYLTQWRVALAAHLLGHSRLSLARIAEQVGYETEASFNRAFKRAYGVPPASWRRLGNREAKHAEPRS